MKKKPEQSKSSEHAFRDQCRVYLAEKWKIASEQHDSSNPGPLHGETDLIKLIADCLNSTTMTYHYVLPTQVLAKCVHPALDARCVQVGSGFVEAFDARSLAHKVIVPFDQENSNVLGGSASPYISNPLRVTGIVPEKRSAQKNKVDWDKLVAVLDLIQTTNDPKFTESVFDQILIEISRLLEHVSVIYPTPSRISLVRTQHLLDSFLSEKSGGDRTEVVATALMRTIGERFGIFDTVRREKVNSADRSSGMSGDIECCIGSNVVMLVEVKEQQLNLVSLNSKIESARSRRIQEMLFIAQNGMSPGDEVEVNDVIQSQFSSGQNVYIESLADFALGMLVLFGEKGRVAFLHEVCAELDRNNSGVQHKKAWANLLKSI